MGHAPRHQMRLLGRQDGAAVAQPEDGGPEAQVDRGEVVESEEVARPRAVRELAVVAEVNFVVQFAVLRTEEHSGERQFGHVARAEGYAPDAAIVQRAGSGIDGPRAFGRCRIVAVAGVVEDTSVDACAAAGQDAPASAEVEAAHHAPRIGEVKVEHARVARRILSRLEAHTGVHAHDPARGVELHGLHALVVERQGEARILERREVGVGKV